MPKQWEIWYANFAFEDNPSIIKKRPVLIIDDKKAFPILVAKVTKTKPREGYWGEYQIEEWREAGLNYPSTVRLSKRMMLEDSDLAYKIGQLSVSDIIKIQELIKNK